MKKLFSILSLLPSLAFAQLATNAYNTDGSPVLFNNTVGSNFVAIIISASNTVTTNAVMGMVTGVTAAADLRLSNRLDDNDADDAWMAFQWLTTYALGQTPMADGMRDGFSSTNGIAYLTNAAWSAGNINMDSTGITGSGGTLTTNGTDLILTFTNNGTATFSFAVTGQALVVAGGGGGGHGVYFGGGGGAGGLLYTNLLSITAGSYAVTVGLGGLGGQAASKAGTNGQDSVFASMTAIGGGGGGDYDGISAHDGGSGGGVGYHGAIGHGTAGQGFDGGTNGANGAAGGGGAGAAGQNGSGIGGNGGNGSQYDISGVATYYAGGGGGGAAGVAGGAGGLGGGGGGSSGAGTNGVTSTGGGGGGSERVGSPVGGRGGSGIVILRFPANLRTLGTAISQAKSTGTVMDFTPTEGLLYLLINSSTLNATQIQAYISRDSTSTNWVSTPLQNMGPLLVTNTALRRWQGGLVTLPGVGSNVSLKVETTNQVSFGIKGWAVQVR